MKTLLLAIGLILFSNFSMAQAQTNFIVIDQFGYLPDAPKVAVIRDPITGFDAGESYTPGSVFALVDAETNSHVLTAVPTAWKNGNTDASSGDRAWWFDFSEVSDVGSYYVLDVQNNKRSHEFRISPAAYNEVFRQAFRVFFYQRVGFAKQEPFAATAWADEASHMGALQDKQARLYNDRSNPATERDVSGAWFDAGDYNKYTSWTADYVINMMFTYKENPEVWTDDFNIPESGNGISDLLDEAKWGLDHLLRMQNADGGVLSVVGLAHASPPSAATGPSLYGPASTSATLASAGAFSIASMVYRSIGMTEYADLLINAAVRAWDWAEVNPAVLFRNNDPNPPYFSANLGAGQQEVDDYGRLTMSIRAACFLFAATGEVQYREFFDSNYLNVNMMQWWFAFPFQSANQDMLLFYTTIQDATPSVAQEIRNRYNHSMMNSTDNFPAVVNRTDPYQAHLQVYTWGSNNIKMSMGNMFLNVTRFNTGSLTPKQTHDAAIGYINSIHGVNPLNLVYLSNMFRYGAENSVREFYHSWFFDGSTKWDRVGTSVYGPPPGFLTGGPNPSYDWDGCCPSGCGSAANNAQCHAESISPPKDQPPQKSYKDFNTSWPLNSWSVTENSNGYQIGYLRLLANFVNPEYDCNGVVNGEALLDVCGRCTGGNTGIAPETNPDSCKPLAIVSSETSKFIIYPNPAKNRLHIARAVGAQSMGGNLQIDIVDAYGRTVMKAKVTADSYCLNIETLPNGIYLLIIQCRLVSDYL